MSACLPLRGNRPLAMPSKALSEFESNDGKCNPWGLLITELRFPICVPAIGPIVLERMPDARSFLPAKVISPAPLSQALKSANDHLIEPIGNAGATGMDKGQEAARSGLRRARRHPVGRRQ